MPRNGKCTNYATCLLAYRNEAVTVADDEPFLCPECKQPLVDAGRPGRKPIAIPLIILGGISLLVVMGAGAVYLQVCRLGEKQPAGQIGTSFEQAQVAGEHGEFLPSRHMSAVDSPTPGASPATPAPSTP